MKEFEIRDGDPQLEAALKRYRSEPRDEFARAVVDRIGGSSRAVSLFALSRLSFAAAVTVLILGSVVSFGGLGYAATGAGEAADAVGTVLAPAKRGATVVRNSPAQTGHVEPTERQQIEVAAATKRRQQPLQAAVRQRQDELPFTGLALMTTVAFALMLIALGVFLRRIGRARAAA
jgi:hypothetical protein